MRLYPVPARYFIMGINASDFLGKSIISLKRTLTACFVAADVLLSKVKRNFRLLGIWFHKGYFT